MAQGGVAMGPHGPEVLGHELVRAMLRDHRLAPPPGLGLEAQGLRATTFTLLGHRAGDDPFAPMAKVRKQLDELVATV